MRILYGIRWALALFLINSLILFGCESSSQQSEIKQADSLAVYKADSTAKFVKAEESKVLADIDFGIDKATFDQKIKRFDHSNEFKGKYGLTRKRIGEYVYRQIDGLFDAKKLYSVYVTGDLTSYEKYDSDLMAQANVLLATIRKKYGPPQYGTGPIAMYRTQKGYTYLSYGWHVGTKDIEIRISDEEPRYSVDLDIYQPNVRKKIDDIEKKRTDSTATKSANVL